MSPGMETPRPLSRSAATPSGSRRDASAPQPPAVTGAAPAMDAIETEMLRWESVRGSLRVLLNGLANEIRATAGNRAKSEALAAELDARTERLVHAVATPLAP